MHLVDLGDRYTYMHTYLGSYKKVVARFDGGGLTGSKVDCLSY